MAPDTVARLGGRSVRPTNAAGRAVGTVLSGVLYEASGEGSEGLFACVAASVILVALAAVTTQRLVRAEEGARAPEATGL